MKIQECRNRKNVSVVMALWVSILILMVSCRGAQEQPVEVEKAPPAYKNKSLPADERIDDLLERMTLEEKIKQLSGTGKMEAPGVERLGIMPFKTTDGPVGVGFGKATAFPASVALASTWDTALINRIGKALGRETRERGRDCLLAPCINIHRFPVGGRNFESFGEDPHLSGEIAKAYVKGVQSQDVIACVKHFAGNNQEWNRMKLDVEVDERTLREIYLPMFKAAVVDGGARCVMSAYNKINGKHCTENPHLLQGILKDEWGFEGFVISDWGAVESTVPSANAGNDMEMPKAEFWGDSLLKAVGEGAVKESVIDDKIRRILRARIESGTFDRTHGAKTELVSNPSHESLALESAKESIILLKNDPAILPIDRKAIKTLALIGPNAVVARIGGGGSSEVVPFYAVSPIEGVKAVVGEGVKVSHALGSAPFGDVTPIADKYFVPPPGHEGVKGLLGEYFTNNKFEGKPALTRVDSNINFNWGYGAPIEDHRGQFSIRWRGKLIAPQTGTFKFIALYDDGIRLRVGSNTLVNNLNKRETRNNMHSETVLMELEQGKEYEVELEYLDNASLAQVQLGWEIPGEDPIAEAVALAKESDMAIVFAGLSKNLESEDKDRERLDMPNQDKLIDAVVAANPKTVVVIQTGTPVSMGNWHTKVPAIMQSWFPGQEGGKAIADLLFGLANPSAKLPCSFIYKMEDCPAFEGYKDPSLKAKFQEGVFVGYRHLEKEGIEPLFPFGHGLSYTQFEYSNLKIEGDLGDGTGGEGPGKKVTFEVENIGGVAGKEIVQLYVGDSECTVDRPKKELKGFLKVTLKPGEKKQVSLVLGRDGFAFYDVNEKSWKVEPGEFTIHVGSSSKDIRLKGKIRL